MIKLIFKAVKKILFSCFLLYGYNLLIQPVGLIIPINIFTILIISFLGIPALLSLIFIMVLIY